MASIKIRGIGLKEIPYFKAVSLKQKLDDKMVDGSEWVSIDNLSFKIGDITAVSTERTETAVEKNTTGDIDNEYYRNRHNFLVLSPEEKSKRMYFFELFYKIMMDVDLSNETRSEAEKIQFSFFKENPYRMYCDPLLYRPVTNTGKAKIGMFFHVIEKIISEDMFYVKYKLCS